MRTPVNMPGVNFDISSNSGVGEQLDRKGHLWNEESGLGRLGDTSLPLCVLGWTGAKAMSISQVSYTVTECKRMYPTALEMCLWGSFVPVLRLLSLWGMWVQPLQWARWWCLRNVHLSKGFLLTTDCRASTGSIRLLVLDKYFSMVH